jgi:hypothetical protein
MYLFSDTHVITISHYNGLPSYTFVKTYSISLSAIQRNFRKRFPEALILVETLTQYLGMAR